MGHGHNQRSGIATLWRRWRTLELTQQFLICSAGVLVIGMALIGTWVADRITRAVVHNTAHAAALYMEGSVGPLIQELEQTDTLAEATMANLDKLLEESSIREHVVSMKVWRLDGTILFSRWKDMIGRKFAPSESFSRAVAGKVAAEFENEPHVEDAHERAVASPLLEIYAPVRSAHSRQVIAVAEFYADGEKLQADLREATVLSWLVVGAVTALMLTALSGIVYGGSLTIADQRRQLTRQIGDLKALLAQNEELRHRLQQSSERIADINDRILQRIGADLHDGPAQLLTYSLLRLGKFAPLIEDARGPRGSTDLQRMRSALSEALSEIRNISSGLSLPQLGTMSLGEAIALAVGMHQEHTGTKVHTAIDELPTDVPLQLKICAYRFVQEGLANAYRHAGAIEQEVAARSGPRLEISVSDKGPGFAPGGGVSEGLGLTGMRARIEALGGTLSIVSEPGCGACLTAQFDLEVLQSKGGRHGTEG